MHNESPIQRARRLPMVASGTPLGNLVPAFAEASALADGEAVDALNALLPAVGDFLLAPIRESSLWTTDEVNERINDRIAVYRDEADRERDELLDDLRRERERRQDWQDRCERAVAVLDRAFFTASDDLHADADTARLILHYGEGAA